MTNQEISITEVGMAAMETIGHLKERIAELENEVKQYKAVENWVRSFTIDELEAHNLEQQANGIMDFKKWVLDTDQNSSDIDVRDINLIEFYVEPLISQAKALKEKGNE